MQPTYLPWIGYFDLMDQVDAFVLLDNVQFDKRSWQQRNRIKTPKGLEWLTVPVNSKGRYDQPISDVTVSDSSFCDAHLRSIEVNYRKAPFFTDVFSRLKAAYQTGAPWQNLVSLTEALIRFLAAELGVRTPICRASALQAQGKRAQLLASICEELGASEYVTPPGSLDYLRSESAPFAEKDIAIGVHIYEHPQYRQLFPPFVPFASALDLVLNEGVDSGAILRHGRRERQPLADFTDTQPN